MVAGYSVPDVAKLLDLSPGRVRAWVAAGLVRAAAGPRGEPRFSFQDLVLFRAAKDLVGAKVTLPRVRTALRSLRESLPEGRGLSGMRIAAEGHRVVVQDGAKRWNPESGQLHFDFEVDDLARRAAPLARKQAEAARRSDLDADGWYEFGCDMETPSPEDARMAYRRALELDPDHAEAHVNLGRLLHELGDYAAAESHYRAALRTHPEDATAAYNLAVALEDAGRLHAAVGAYEQALAADPELADAHYNLARIHEHLGHNAAAIRHLRAYRELDQPRAKRK